MGVWLSLLLFPEYASMIMMTITVAASTPIVFRIISFEAKRHATKTKHLFEHRKALQVFTFLFIGFLLGYTVGFFSLPLALRDLVFSAQAEAITALTGGFNMVWFNEIVFNNLRILLFCLILSLFFGTGGTLILAWNASVMALAIGSFILAKMAAGSPMVFAVAASLSRYLIHGIPEMVSYFMAGLAGGLIFHSIARKNWSRQVAWEAFLLVLASAALLVVSALVEVYFRPFVA